MKALWMSLAISTLALGCTTNVENPTVDQTGRTGDTTCVTDCDADKVTCAGKCSDDTCKASCETTHTSCSKSCTSGDGG